jgi:hypothetical protein
MWRYRLVTAQQPTIVARPASAGLLLSQGVIWVAGGSVANLLAVWQTHDLEPVLRGIELPHPPHQHIKHWR